MTEDIQINVYKRGRSECVESDYRIIVKDGMRAITALERIADVLESGQNVKDKEGGAKSTTTDAITAFTHFGNVTIDALDLKLELARIERDLKAAKAAIGDE